MWYKFCKIIFAGVKEDLLYLVYGDTEKFNQVNLLTENYKNQNYYNKLRYIVAKYIVQSDPKDLQRVIPEIIEIADSFFPNVKIEDKEIYYLKSGELTKAPYDFLTFQSDIHEQISLQKIRNRKNKAPAEKNLLLFDKQINIFPINNENDAKAFYRILPWPGSPWCVTRENDNLWWNYRRNYESNFYFIIDNNFDTNSPYYAVALDHNKNGFFGTTFFNGGEFSADKKNISEYGDKTLMEYLQGYGYTEADFPFRPLTEDEIVLNNTLSEQFSKELDLKLLIQNKSPLTQKKIKDPQYELAKLKNPDDPKFSDPDDPEQFIDNLAEKYIQAPHYLSNEQLEYLINNNAKELLNAYVNTDLILNNSQLSMLDAQLRKSYDRKENKILDKLKKNDEFEDFVNALGLTNYNNELIYKIINSDDRKQYDLDFGQLVSVCLDGGNTELLDKIFENQLPFDTDTVAQHSSVFSERMILYYVSKTDSHDHYEFLDNYFRYKNDYGYHFLEDLSKLTSLNNFRFTIYDIDLLLKISKNLNIDLYNFNYAKTFKNEVSENNLDGVEKVLQTIIQLKNRNEEEIHFYPISLYFDVLSTEMYDLLIKYNEEFPWLLSNNSKEQRDFALRIGNFDLFKKINNYTRSEKYIGHEKNPKTEFHAAANLEQIKAALEDPEIINLINWGKSLVNFGSNLRALEFVLSNYDLNTLQIYPADIIGITQGFIRRDLANAVKIMLKIFPELKTHKFSYDSFSFQFFKYFIQLGLKFNVESWLEMINNMSALFDDEYFETIYSYAPQEIFNWKYPHTFILGRADLPSKNDLQIFYNRFQHPSILEFAERAGITLNNFNNETPANNLTENEENVYEDSNLELEEIDLPEEIDTPEDFDKQSFNYKHWVRVGFHAKGF